MRALIQRVSSAQVTVEGRAVGSIGPGLLVFVAIHKEDTPADGEWVRRKILSLRLFEDEGGRMGRSVGDLGGGLLVVSQFTLHGRLDKGTRPDFSQSMAAEPARAFYEQWLADFRRECPLKIEAGVFAATMQVQLVNDGPVTLMIDSRGN